VLALPYLCQPGPDEVPQLWGIIKGDMRFVGPRLALFNQDDLVAQRIFFGVAKLVPGLTGWVQVNGRDELLIPVKLAFDVEYLEKLSLLLDLRILVLTVVKAIRRKNISH